MTASPHFFCSNGTMCANPVLPLLVAHAVQTICPELDGMFNIGSLFRPRMMHYQNRHSIVDIMKSNDPIKMLENQGHKNISHLFLGPEPFNARFLVNVAKQNFLVSDKLFKTKGVALVVHKDELDAVNVIFQSITHAKGIIILSMLLATSVAILMWIVVSIFFFHAQKSISLLSKSSL